MTPKLSPARADILRLCASHDRRGVAGIPAWSLRYLKPKAKQALSWLRNSQLVTIDVYGNAVATDEGREALWASEDEEANSHA